MKEENEEELERPKALRQNRLPGSEKLTRPEELDYLSKFLGGIRKIQDDHTELPDWELGLYGRDSGNLPKIKELEDKLVGISENQHSDIIELPTDPVKGSDNYGISEFNLHKGSEKLTESETQEPTKLDDSIERISDNTRFSINNSKDKLPFSENKELNIDPGTVEMFGDDPTVNLHSTSENISGDKKDVNLGKDKESRPGKDPELKVKDSEKLPVEEKELAIEDPEKIVGNHKNIVLGNSIYRLNNQEELNLPTERKDLNSDIEISLPNSPIKLVSEGGIEELPNSTININPSDIEILPNDLVSTSVTDIDTLEDRKVGLDITDVDFLESYLDNLEVYDVNDLGENLIQRKEAEDKTSYNNIQDPKYNNWSEELEDTRILRSSAEDSTSHNNYHPSQYDNWSEELENRKLLRLTAEDNTSYNNIQDSEYDNWSEELESKKILRSSAEGFDSINNIQDPGYSNWRDCLEDFIEKCREDRLNTKQKDLLNDAFLRGSINENELFNTFMDIIGKAKVYVANKEEVSGATEEWYKKLEAIVTSYMMRNNSQKVPLLDREDFNSLFIRPVERSDGREYFSDMYDNEGYLTSADRNSTEVTGYKTLDSNFSSLTKSSNMVKIPKYVLPIKEPSGTLVSKFLNFTFNEKSKSLIRRTAEEIVEKTGKTGSNKTKSLVETLLALAFSEMSIEKALEQNLDRLPGSSKNIIKDIVDLTSKVNSMADSIKNVGKFTLDTANKYQSIVKSGADIIGGLTKLGGTKKGSEKNRPIVDWESSIATLKGVILKKEKSTKDQETKLLESANSRNDLARLADTVENYRIYESSKAVDIPGASYDSIKDSSVKDYLKNNDNKDFSEYYIHSEGIHTTLYDLCDSGTGKKFNTPGSFEELKKLLMNSEHITTVNKVGESSVKNKYKSMTLSDNSYWEIRIEPFCDYNLNGGWSYLPAIQEINIFNQRVHGINTGYNEWIPVVSFDYERSKLNTKSVALYEGEIVVPTTSELLNELRLSIVDDQYKSWSMYFRTCMEVAVFNSIPHNMNYYRNCNTETKAAYSGRFSNVDAILPTFIDRSHVCTALYKNVTFRVRIYILTPQYSTLKSFDLLCVLKDFQENYMGTIDAGGQDVDLIFSVVGENPDIYQAPSTSYDKNGEELAKFSEAYRQFLIDNPPPKNEYPDWYIKEEIEKAMEEGTLSKPTVVTTTKTIETKKVGNTDVETTTYTKDDGKTISTDTTEKSVTKTKNTVTEKVVKSSKKESKPAQEEKTGAVVPSESKTS